jgi:hypothetical protein
MLFPPRIHTSQLPALQYFLIHKSRNISNRPGVYPRKQLCVFDAYLLPSALPR